MTEDTLNFIPTRGSQSKLVNNFEAVCFKSYKPKGRSQTEEETKTVTKEEGNIFNIKKTKNEIIRFGISGLDSGKKADAKIQLAIKLGAKPTRNKYKNYKDLIKERKIEMVKEKSVQTFQAIGKNSVGKSTAKGKSFDRKRRKYKGGLLDVYGKVKVSGKNTENNKS